jgi:two-component system CheB/CheR fusion protein
MTSLREAEILVVDDDHDSLEIIEYLIAREGGVVRKARNSREALELLLSCTPDVMLLDLSMPDMDGFELLTTIRGVARLSEVPAVAVTAHAYERDKERSAKAGFVAHVSKPYDVEALIKVIGDLVEKKPADP